MAAMGRGQGPARRVTGWLLAVLVLGAGPLLTGCGAATTPASASGPHREWRVAEDPDATVEDIVEVGSPTVAKTSGDRTMVAWTAEPEDDEGRTQAAWRMYDAQGQRVAQGRLGIIAEASAVPSIWAVPDGFLLQTYTDHDLLHFSPTGASTPVPASRSSVPTRPGDLLLDDFTEQGYSFYRPASRTAYRLPKLPVAHPQRVALDAGGTVWVLEEWAARTAGLSSAAGGTGPWQHTEIPLPTKGTPMGLAVVGDRVVVPVLQDVPHREYPVLRSLWTLPVTTRAGTWTRIPTSGLTLEMTWEPSLHGLGEGRIVIGGDTDDGPTYLERASGGFARLPRPPGAAAGYLQVSSPTVFFASRREHRLYRSDDEGRTWATVRP